MGTHRVERHSNEATKHPGKTCLGIGHHVWEHHSAKGFVAWSTQVFCGAGEGWEAAGVGAGEIPRSGKHRMDLYTNAPLFVFLVFLRHLHLSEKDPPPAQFGITEAKYVTSTKLTQEHFSAEPQNSHEFSSIAKLQELVYNVSFLRRRCRKARIGVCSVA